MRRKTGGTGRPPIPSRWLSSHPILPNIGPHEEPIYARADRADFALFHVGIDHLAERHPDSASEGAVRPVLRRGDADPILLLRRLFRHVFPSGYFVERVGYRSGIVAGLTVAGIGCAAFYPAAAAHSYTLFLAALFVLASGITLLQVAANPYVAILGDPKTAASRLNLTQAFNSAGTTVGPWIGAVLILSVASAGAAATQTPYLVLVGTLFVIAIVFSRLKLPQISPDRKST